MTRRNDNFAQLAKQEPGTVIRIEGGINAGEHIKLQDGRWIRCAKKRNRWLACEEAQAGAITDLEDLVRLSIVFLPWLRHTNIRSSQVTARKVLHAIHPDSTHARRLKGAGFAVVGVRTHDEWIIHSWFDDGPYSGKTGQIFISAVRTMKRKASTLEPMTIPEAIKWLADRPVVAIMNWRGVVFDLDHLAIPAHHILICGHDELRDRLAAGGHISSRHALELASRASR